MGDTAPTTPEPTTLIPGTPNALTPKDSHYWVAHLSDGTSVSELENGKPVRSFSSLDTDKVQALILHPLDPLAHGVYVVHRENSGRIVFKRRRSIILDMSTGVQSLGAVAMIFGLEFGNGRPGAYTIVYPDDGIVLISDMDDPPASVT